MRLWPLSLPAPLPRGTNPQVVMELTEKPAGPVSGLFHLSGGKTILGFKEDDEAKGW